MLEILRSKFSIVSQENTTTWMAWNGKSIYFQLLKFTSRLQGKKEGSEG